MSDNTQLNPATVPGGDVISDEEIAATPGVKMPRSKLVTGAHGIDGGDVTETNPLPILDAGALIPKRYDEIAITYNVDGTIATAVYKLASVTQATLTLTYTSGNLTGVVRT